ncbi:hypothetical protein MHU86_25245 [Fragilaria crotonensis]|nr:hypothetical protein MHU86_25245 [Fragilaria crotonensis]
MRKTASTTLTQHPTVHEGQVGRHEIDNHADTICAGPNWRVLEFTGQFCSVAPFSMEYSPKVNVPVAKCASTYLCPTTGQSVLLIVDQALWFTSCANNMRTIIIVINNIRNQPFYHYSWWSGTAAADIRTRVPPALLGFFVMGGSVVV